MRSRRKLIFSCPRDCFDPAECLLDPLENARADGLAAVPGRSPVNRGATAAGVVCNMRRHVHRAQLVDEVFCIAALSARRAIMCSAGEAHLRSTSSNAIAPSMACWSVEKDSIPWARRACRSGACGRGVTDRTCGKSQKDGFASVLIAPSAGTRSVGMKQARAPLATMENSYVSRSSCGRFRRRSPE
jgi:hypothetical protein